MLAPNKETQRIERRRARWRRWYWNDKRGMAIARVQYSGVGLANLVLSGWLPSRREVYTDQEIATAISNLLEHGELPRRH